MDIELPEHAYPTGHDALQVTAPGTTLNCPTGHSPLHNGVVSPVSLP